MTGVTLANRAVRLRGLELKASQQARCTRLHPGSRFGTDGVLIPWTTSPATAAADLVAVLADLVPPDAAPVASGA